MSTNVRSIEVSRVVSWPDPSECTGNLIAVVDDDELNELREKYGDEGITVGYTVYTIGASGTAEWVADCADADTALLVGRALAAFLNVKLDVRYIPIKEPVE